MTFVLRSAERRRRQVIGALGGLGDPVQTLIDMYEGGTYGGALYDPSNAASMFQDRSATPATPAGNGQVVGTMADLSPNGIEAIAPADANRGTLTQSGDLWYIACNGNAASHNYVSTWGATVATPFTVAIAAQIDNNNDYLCCGSGTSNRHSLYSNGADGGTGGFRMFGGAILDHDSVAVDRFVARVYVAVFAGTSSVWRLNGVASSNTDAGTQSHTATRWGARFDGTQPLEGRIYMAMKIHKALDASEITAVESVFQDKCGVSF